MYILMLKSKSELTFSINDQIVNVLVLVAKRQNGEYYVSAYIIREKINFHKILYKVHNKNNQVQFFW